MAKGNPDPAVLVRKSWAERVDAATKESAKEVASERAKQAGDASLFYDVRRVQIYGEARSLSSTLYEYDAFFVAKNGNVDSGYKLLVYQWDSNASTRFSNAARTWVIWRGRWEILVPCTNVFGGRGIEADYSSSGVTLNNSGVTGLLVGNANLPPSVDQYGYNSVSFNGGQFDVQTIDGKKSVRLKYRATPFVKTCTLPDVRNVYYKFVVTTLKDGDGRVIDVGVGVQATTKAESHFTAAYLNAEGATTAGTINRVYNTNGSLE